MSPDVELFLIAAVLPAIMLLAWRLGSWKNTFLRVVIVTLISWPIVSNKAVKQIDHDVAAWQATHESDEDWDGVGDRIAMFAMGWMPPLICSIAFIAIRWSIDRFLLPSKVASIEAEW